MPYSAPLVASSRLNPSGSSAPPHVGHPVSTLSTPTTSSAAAARSPSALSTSPQSSDPSRQVGLTTFYPQWKTIASRIAVNEAKFLPMPTSHSPILNEAWAFALRKVINKWQRVWDHENLEVLRGYPFPDPHILVKDTSPAVGGKLFILGWLALRPAWIARFSNGMLPSLAFPGPQQ